MSAPSTPSLEAHADASPAHLRRSPASALAAVGLSVALLLVAGVSIAAALAGGNAVFALAPLGFVAGGALLAVAPLRQSVAIVLFVLLAVEDSLEWYGQWRSPLAVVGNLLHGRVDQAIGLPGLAVTGMELLLVALFAVRLLKVTHPDRSLQTPAVEPAGVVRDLLLIYVAAVLFSEAYGIARGLHVAPWKLRNMLHPVLLALVFIAAFRHTWDFALVRRVLVAAAVIKALQAWVVQIHAKGLHGGSWETATSHGDSVLFAVAFLVLVIAFLEHPSRRNLLVAVAFLPFVTLGAIENERRLVWVMILLGLVFVYLVSPRSTWKRLVTYAALVATPIVALYVGVGWNSGSPIFGPVQTLRSVSDTSVNRSAYWREVETWNIAMTLRDRPLLGTGLGGEYVELMMNDDISVYYAEYREWPHNTVLGLLMLMGFFAFTATWVLMPVVVFLALRTYRFATQPEERIAALSCVAMISTCLVMAWGDTGSHYPQHKIVLALAVAIAARLATSTGAWPARPIQPAA